MRDSLLRVIDDLETRQQEALNQSRLQNDDYWYGFWTGVHNSLEYANKELRKVLDDHGKS